MKRFFILIGFFVLATACELDPLYESAYYECKGSITGDKNQHPDSADYQNLLNEIISFGVPGIMMTVSDEAGVWSGASGKADLASDIDLKPCNITRTGSTVKTMTAVTILLLQEEGKLDLDDKIADYLSAEILNGLANAKVVTIRQLLQHSSGIYNYIADPHFQTASLNDLIKVWKPNELLSYARKKPADFTPGTDARYSNTGYILLGEIIEVVESKPFYKVFEEKLIQPVSLLSTQFAAKNPVPEGIIQGYIDLYSNLNVVNATYYSGWDYFTADGGLISNAYDLNRFLMALFAGNLLSDESLKEMTNWKAPREQDSEGFETYYGLGIFKIMTDYGPAYLHSGDAIGYFASMVYFPEQKVTISWAVNGNYGKIDEFTQSKKGMEYIFKTVMNSTKKMNNEPKIF